MAGMNVSRRGFLGACAAVSAGAWACRGWAQAPAPPASPGSPRSFHLSTSPEALEVNPDLLPLCAKAGVTTLWICGFFYGYWPFAPERIQQWMRRVEAAGLATNMINIPLGHPGNALGSSDGTFPLAPPKHWRVAVKPDGSTYAGTSLHPPATEENVAAMRTIAQWGVRRVFLDDDFRLAISPGTIGGCFCDEHRDQFLRSRGYQPAAWDELKDSVQRRALTPVMREWIAFTCDQLTACFRAQQAAAPNTQLGPMVMYFGAEKAGIRLADYAGAPLRVGELMFSDPGFSRIEGKTSELFSCLFHRRYVTPELAFSESTAYPSDQLSAKNMAAKLVISTIADVRNTMYMSGITPFPLTHWETLGPAMAKQAAIHAKLAGHTPRGPFKHFWGEAARCVGDDTPYGLFLATGMPFEVVDAPPKEGWAFLSDADAQHGATVWANNGATAVVRPAMATALAGSRAVEESLPALFALKHEALAKLQGVPYVEEDKPVVCAWYPTARAALLWNLAEQKEAFTLKIGENRRTAEIDALDVALIEDVNV